MTPTVTLSVEEQSGGWTADVKISDAVMTTHRVGVTRAEHARFGGGEVADLVRRSIEFLLAREPNTSILREFNLTTIERYFPDYREAIALPR